MPEKLSEVPQQEEMPHQRTSEYFDPAYQPVPEEILGVPTEPLLNLTKAAGNLAMLGSGKIPIKVSRVALTASLDTKKALPLFPLIEKVQAGETVTPEEVRPYRKSIKKIVPQLRMVDRLAKLSSVVFIGIPIRRYLNRRIEKEFPGRVSPMLDKASEYLPQAEPYVDYLSSFENPREQFVSEVTLVADGIRASANKRAAEKNRPVTSSDAAYGIRETVDSILSNRETSHQRLPMVSNLLIERLSKRPELPSMDVLTVVAPEIILALNSVIPKDKRDNAFYTSIKSRGGSTRLLAETFKARDLRIAGEVAQTLLPSIRDLLPTSGKELKATYLRISKFLNKSQY